MNIDKIKTNKLPTQSYGLDMVTQKGVNCHEIIEMLSLIGVDIVVRVRLYVSVCLKQALPPFSEYSRFSLCIPLIASSLIHTRTTPSKKLYLITLSTTTSMKV